MWIWCCRAPLCLRQAGRPKNECTAPGRLVEDTSVHVTGVDLREPHQLNRQHTRGGPLSTFYDDSFAIGLMCRVCESLGRPGRRSTPSALGLAMNGL